MLNTDLTTDAPFKFVLIDVIMHVFLGQMYIENNQNY
jgi:hypothetical protein